MMYQDTLFAGGRGVMQRRRLRMADLFCGAGGTSTGARQAAEAHGLDFELTAVNHWPTAVSTHSTNHPDARHFCASLDSLNPRELYREGELDILWASPECTHHSNARGGRPMSDQSRATAWCVIRWAEALRPARIFVENVPEFLSWGPLDSRGRPLKSRQGELFRAWVNTLEACGYRVEWRKLCAADYGDPTTRRRLFIQAARGRRRLTWPDPTHARREKSDLVDRRMAWRSAREIIDWSIPGNSIYQRKRPLRPKTMSRIFAGLRRFGLSPFLTETAHGGDRRPRSLEEPLATVAGNRGDAALVQPFLIAMRGTSPAHLEASALKIEQPLGAVTSGGNHFGLVEPFLLPQQSGGRARAVSEPTPTVAAAGAIGLVEPFLVQYYGTGKAQAVDEPLATVTTKHRHGLVMPVVLVDGERYRLDIHFRMLQPHELAAAQGFPAGYQFAGTKTEQVRQIGNAVPPGIARALVAAALAEDNHRGLLTPSQKD